ncbi:MAG: hypothetical protein AAGA48_16450 [Myxococcota bacterium]
MGIVRRRIGLSLGADICWPAAFEALIGQMGPIRIGNDEVHLECERTTVRPFSLRETPAYDLVVDRLTHWFHTQREWVKQLALQGVYVLNNPWAVQSMEKHTSYVAMMQLGFPIPETIMVPPKEYATDGDWTVTVRKYNRLFDLGAVGRSVGYPAFFKPYDGGGWVGVRRVTDDATLGEAYDASGLRVHHLQAAVQGWDRFVRVVGIGPQVRLVDDDPDASLHNRYRTTPPALTDDQTKLASAMCRTINAFFGWDFNSCEVLRANGVLHPIDFANACPDSQVTSLHVHFPWLVTSLLKWSVFAAVTQRKKNLGFAWDRFFAARDTELSLDEQIARYDAIASELLDAERFAEFEATHFADLDERARAYFATDEFRRVVREKVTALYPHHEIEDFTELFFERVQQWRPDGATTPA